MSDAELLAYKRQLGSEQYNKLYHRIYTLTKDRIRDNTRYRNREGVDMEAIKHKYRNGVTHQILEEMFQ